MPRIRFVLEITTIFTTLSPWGKNMEGDQILNQ